MEATMKKKVGADEDDETERFGKQKKKPQSDFMKQLTDLAQQAVELPPEPEPLPDEIKPQVALTLASSFLHFFHLSLSRKRKDLQVHLQQLVD